MLGRVAIRNNWILSTRVLHAPVVRTPSSVQRSFADRSTPRIVISTLEDLNTTKAQCVHLIDKVKDEWEDNVHAQIQFERSLADKYFKESQFQIETKENKTTLKRIDGNYNVAIEFEVFDEPAEIQDDQEMDMWSDTVGNALDKELDKAAKVLKSREKPQNNQGDKKALKGRQAVDEDENNEEDEDENDNDNDDQDEEQEDEETAEGITRNKMPKFKDRPVNITISSLNAKESSKIKMTGVAAADGKFYVLEAQCGGDTAPKITFEKLPAELQDKLYDFLVKLNIDDRLSNWVHHYSMRVHENHRSDFLGTLRSFLASDLPKLSTPVPSGQVHIGVAKGGAKGTPQTPPVAGQQRPSLKDALNAIQKEKLKQVLKPKK